MQDYNLTAELKKIATGVSTSNPNTELGNINNGVGNLDTAMQSVATAIGNISIPNPGTNIDGVATAITNKTIPDPSSNITAVATAVDNLAGGKDLGDIETILTTMNGNIANLGTNHITDLIPTTGGYIMGRGSGLTALLPNEARYTSYIDTNNIGATDVQSAVTKLSTYAYGSATLNSTYITSGSVIYQQFGKVVTVTIQNIRFSSLPASASFTDAFATGLPNLKTVNENPTILLMPNAPVNYPIRLLLSAAGNVYFHFSGTSFDNAQYYGTFSYICQ